MYHMCNVTTDTHATQFCDYMRQYWKRSMCSWRSCSSSNSSERLWTILWRVHALAWHSLDDVIGAGISLSNVPCDHCHCHTYALSTQSVSNIFIWYVNVRVWPQQCINRMQPESCCVDESAGHRNVCILRLEDVPRAAADATWQNRTR